MSPVPARIGTDALRALCAELTPGMGPMLLAVRPAAHALPLACFDAVALQVSRHGGDACYGWQVWEWPHVLLEAEFHAVWRDGNGALHDITPKREPRSSILFVEDPVRRFEGRRIANVYWPMIDHPAVRQFVAACEEEFELLTAGDRAVSRNMVLAPWEEAALRAIRERKLAFARALGIVE